MHNLWPAGTAVLLLAVLVGLLGVIKRRASHDEPQLPTQTLFDKEPQDRTWALLNEESRLLLDAQRTGAERVETKAALVIGAALAAAQFVARESVDSYWLPASLVAYALCIGSGLICVSPRRFENLSLERTMKGVWWYPHEFAVAEVLNNRNEAVKANAKRHQARVLWFWLSITFLGGGAMMSALHLRLGKETDDRLNGTCIESAVPGTFTCTARR